jgi:hypothetical protein
VDILTKRRAEEEAEHRRMLVCVGVARPRNVAPGRRVDMSWDHVFGAG